MKASEVRSLASQLLDAKREDKEKDVTPFLGDPEVESRLVAIYELVKTRVSENPERIFASFPRPFVAEPLKQNALYQRLREYGYDIIFNAPETMTVTWAGGPFESSPPPERPRVSPESKTTLTTRNPFATAEVEKRVFAANVSEDGKVLSVDPVETSHTLTVE